MKAAILLIILSVSTIAQAQLDFKNKTYRLKVKSGAGIEREISLELLTTKDIVMDCVEFREYLSKRQGLVEDIPYDLLVEAFMKYSVNKFISEAQRQIPYPTSLDFPEAEPGVFGISVNDGKILCKIPITASSSSGSGTTGTIYVMNRETFVVLN